MSGPPTITITVNMTSVSTDPFVAKGAAQPIEWVCGAGVASFAITGLASPPFSLAGTPNGGQVSTFRSVDTNNNNGTTYIDYPYTVIPTASSAGAAEAAMPGKPFDPYIRNLP